MLKWFKERTGERTTLDGMTLMLICGSVILFGGVANLLAWAGFAYGIYTTVSSEDES